MAKEQWTDWINHTPGQEVPPGFEIEIELKGRNGDCIVQRGVTSARTKGHGCWHAKDPYGRYKMATRYRLKVIADEVEDDARVSLKVK